MWVVFGYWACPFLVYWLSAVIRVTPHSAREHTHILAKSITHKTLKSVLKTQSSTSVQSVCLVWDQSHASHIPLNTRPPSWHRYRTPPPLPTPTVLKITPTKHTAVPAENPHKIIHVFDPCHFFFPASFRPCAPGDAPAEWCHQQVISWWETSVLIWLSMGDAGLWSVSRYRVSRMGIWE